ncbi:MAG TPA: molybdopterin-dependent oxidoreductase, partial [Nitrospirales bacterium]
HGVTNLINAKPKGLPEDRRSLVLDFNMNRCILCGECINICKDVQMIDALQFFKKEGTTHVVAKGDNALECEFCGDCLAVCPVGAITNKYSKYIYKPWQLKKTTTTCGYCADGCQMQIETSGRDVQRVTSPLSWKNKWGDRADTAEGHGGLCVLGRFGFQYIDSKERLTSPLLRTDEGFVPMPWYDAINLIKDRLTAIKAEHGPNAIAGLITGRCTTEEQYLFQKLMRAAIGTNQLDGSARYGYLNFTRAMQRAAGVGRMMNSYVEITKAKALLLIGTDITETNPITGLRVKEALRVYGAKVVVADWAVTNIAKLASHPLPISPGGEGWFIKGLVKAALDEDLVDEAAINSAPKAFAALKEAVGRLSWEMITAAAGSSKESIVEAARIYAEAATAVILCGEGVLRRTHGYENMLTLVDFAWITGKLTRPGCGINGLPEEANEQGAVDMGVAPELLPGQASYADPDARAKLERVWNVTLPAGPEASANLMEILERCRSGQIKALYLVGENPLATLPASSGVREALDKVQFIISQDPYLTETGRMADVVLPACTSAEKEGTFTDVQGKVNRVRQALEPNEEARPDWEIFAAIGSLLGYPMDYQHSNAIQSEIMKLLPGYYNLGEPRPVVARPEMYLNDGYARDLAARYQPDEGRPPQKPFTLVMGKVLYHHGKMSTRASGLTQLYPNSARLQMHPDDLVRLDVADKDAVRITSAIGTLEMQTEANAYLAVGTCFFPEHFNEPPVKDLMDCAIDPHTGVPTFKLTPVSIEKIEAAGGEARKS